MIGLILSLTVLVLNNVLCQTDESNIFSHPNTNIFLSPLFDLHVSYEKLKMDTDTAKLKRENTDENPPFIRKHNMRIDARTSLPRAIYQIHFPVIGQSAREKADYFLRHFGDDGASKLFGNEPTSLFTSKSDGSNDFDFERNLQYVSEKKISIWTTVRYRQIYHGIPVYKGYVTVTINDNNSEARTFNSNFKKNVRLINESSTDIFDNLQLTPNISRQRVFLLARQFATNGSILGFQSFKADLFIFHDETEQRISKEYEDASMSRLVWRVKMKPRGSHQTLEILFDATDGTVLLEKNLTHEGQKKSNLRNSQPVKKTHSNNIIKRQTQLEIPDISLPDFINCENEGKGYVFDPDPISTSQKRYGEGGFIDAYNSNSEDLRDQLVEVTLRDIRCDKRGKYFLEGPNVRIVDCERPKDGKFSQMSSDFRFERGDNGFEAVMCYYHLDTEIRYIKDDLGIDVTPHHYNGALRVDPHGAENSINAYYSTECGTLFFGQGGVDAAEDAAVIIHELGHAYHDFLTEGGLSQVEGLSEGMADYLAASYVRSKNLWTPDQDEYYWFSHWFGHNEFWDGRRIDYHKTWPHDLVSVIHKDGQIWSSANMEVWDLLGREKSDKVQLMGISSLAVLSGQQDAASAVMAAVEDLGYGNDKTSQVDSIYRKYGYFVECGDGIVEGVEECEHNSDMESFSCEDVGCSGGGSVSCMEGSCMMDYSDCVAGPDEIKFEFFVSTDNYKENSIEFQDISNNTTLVSLPSMEPKTNYTSVMCVPPSGCFMFTISDSSGDGLYGDAFYNIMVNGTEAQNTPSDFDGQANHHFCFY